jgi:hypothetical protein
MSQYFIPIFVHISTAFASSYFQSIYISSLYVSQPISESIYFSALFIESLLSPVCEDRTISLSATLSTSYFWKYIFIHIVNLSYTHQIYTAASSIAMATNVEDITSLHGPMEEESLSRQQFPISRNEETELPGVHSTLDPNDGKLRIITIVTALYVRTPCHPRKNLQTHTIIHNSLADTLHCLPRCDDRIHSRTNNLRRAPICQRLRLDRRCISHS